MRLAPLPLLAALSACATPGKAPDAVSYSAFGENPGWTLLIDHGQVRLTLGPDASGPDGALRSVDYGIAREVAGHEVRRIEAGAGTQVIAIEASPVACVVKAGEKPLLNTVKVYLSGRVLEGCGSPHNGDRGQR